MIKHFPSIQALRSEAIKLGFTESTSEFGAQDTNLSWFNNEKKSDTLSYADTGNTKLVPKAESIIDKLESHIELHRPAWQAAPSGAFPCVPDYCMGLPTNMRRRVGAPDDRSPINILVGTTSSAGISAEILEERGATILALVLTLSRSRPIRLSIVSTVNGSDNGETVLISDINTTPLDIATAAYALSSSGLDRRLHHYISRELNNYSGGWPRSYDRFNNGRNYFDALSLRLGLPPADTLVIPSTYLNDTLVKNPVEWVNTQIKRFTASQEEN